MMFRNLEQEGAVVQATIEFRAPRDKVYKAWTEAEILQKWFFVEQGFEPHDVHVDLRTLGSWSIPISHPDGATETVIYVLTILRYLKSDL